MDFFLSTSGLLKPIRVYTCKCFKVAYVGYDCGYKSYDDIDPFLQDTKLKQVGSLNDKEALPHQELAISKKYCLLVGANVWLL